jgi:hypothetical protein
MSNNPYKSLHDHAFWKNGVERSNINFPENIYNPKWKIDDTDKIVTMGSCFAQHIAKWLRENGFNAPFYEIEEVKENEQTFSANYGNVYTVRQALQLIQESVGKRIPSEIVWGNNENFIDAIRPNSIKGGFKTPEEVIKARELHLKSIQKMIKDFDILVFTLGLTEAWEIKKCGTIIPTAPGILAGNFDPKKYQFLNFKYNEILQDLYSFCELLKTIRNDKPFKLLLTVSPVPLTATASNQHILVASTYSKAVLRSVAGDFAKENNFAEYFPSFEIINNPAAHSNFFENNLRSVKASAVDNVMNIFSSLALVTPRVSSNEKHEIYDPDCEDVLLEEFSKKVDDKLQKHIDMVCIGTSHLASLRIAMSNELRLKEKNLYFFPENWGKNGWTEFNKNEYLTHFSVKDEYNHLIQEMVIKDCDVLVLAGLSLAGDDIIRCHGPMGREFSPEMPIKSVIDRKLIDFYKPSLNLKLQKIRQLDKSTSYKNIFWVAAPDICVNVAKNRLTEKFVNSGSYLIHKKAYMEAFNECLRDFKKIHFIFHDDNLCDPDNGFTLNKYYSSDNPLDIHCNPEYYESSIKKIINYI